MKNKLVEEIMMILSKHDGEINEQIVQQELIILLNDYEIQAKETAVTIWKEDENATFLKRFIVAKTVKGCSDRTIELYRVEIWKMLNKIGKNVTEITTDDIRLYLAIRQRRDKVSNTTADNELRYLRSFFGYLLAEELITKNPVARIEKIKCEKKKKHAFTEYEIEQLRHECNNELDEVIIETLLSTGMRVSELVSVKKEDIENDSVYVRGKGNKYRKVYLNAKAMIAINTFLKKRNDDNPYLFPGGRTITEWSKKISKDKITHWYEYEEYIEKDKKMDIGTIRDRIAKVAKRAGVKNCHPHRFRRTCATMALRRGMPIEQVSQMLGHEQLGTTQIYLDLTEEDLKSAHKKYVV